MKRIFGLLLFLIFACCYGQRSKIDSLQKLLASAEKDTTKIRRYISLGYAYYSPDIDSAFVFGNKALELSQKINWAEGEAKSQALLCKLYGQKGNTPKSLNLALSSLKTFENLHDTINMIDCFINLSLIYSEEDFERSVQYARKGYSLARLINRPRSIMYTSSTLGEGYANLGIADSALVYYQEAYKYSNSIERGKESNLAYIYRGLGRVQYLLNNKDLALTYLYKSLSYASSHNDYNLLANICQIFSDVYKDLGKTDSSLTYSKKSLASSVKTSPQDVLGAYKQLAKLYKGINNDSSVKYFELQTNLRDSLFNAKKKTDLANLTSNEEDRQKEMVVAKQNDADERKRNLQYAAIAIGLIAFIILFVAFSRSIVVKTKFIEFFGVLGLLAVFEFINLFIHPYLAHVTNDSPVLMLAVLIAIGALLIPLHHKLEKWITEIMVEKNKKIRLEAAKKTIAKLEG